MLNQILYLHKHIMYIAVSIELPAPVHQPITLGKGGNSAPKAFSGIPKKEVSSNSFTIESSL